MLYYIYIVIEKEVVVLSKTAVLENRILQDIQAGHYLPGEAIPSRNWLAARYNCSRTTVERAIAALVEAGFLEGRKGSGTYVLSGNPESEIRYLNVVADNPASLEERHSELFFHEDFVRLPTRWFSSRRVQESLEALSKPNSAVIWQNPGEEQISTMDYLHNKQIPQLLLNRTYRNYDRIYTDPVASIREGLAWLMIEAGRDIALVSQMPQTGHPFLAPRIIAFHQICVELGAKLDPNMLFLLDDSRQDMSAEITRAGMRLFAQQHRPRGIFVTSQDIVLRLISCAEEYRLKPGVDYFLITFDFVQELTGQPGIGMLRQPYSLMLREAQRWLAGKNKFQTSPFDVALKADLIVAAGMIQSGA